MNDGLIAIRYARALYSSAKGKGKEDAVYKGICTMTTAFETVPGLKHALSSPTINDKDKISLLTKAAGDKPSKELESFIVFVVNKKRESYMGSIARMYEQLYRKDKNIVVSTVTTASDIKDKSLSRIEKFVEKICDAGKVELRTKTDPSIVGGFILDVEGKRMDASIKGQLSKLYKYAGHKAK